MSQASAASSSDKPIVPYQNTLQDQNALQEKIKAVKSHIGTQITKAVDAFATTDERIRSISKMNIDNKFRQNEKKLTSEQKGLLLSKAEKKVEKSKTKIDQSAKEDIKDLFKREKLFEKEKEQTLKLAEYTKSAMLRSAQTLEQNERKLDDHGSKDVLQDANRTLRNANRTSRFVESKLNFVQTKEKELSELKKEIDSDIKETDLNISNRKDLSEKVHTTHNTSINCLEGLIKLKDEKLKSLGNEKLKMTSEAQAKINVQFDSIKSKIKEIEKIQKKVDDFRIKDNNLEEQLEHLKDEIIQDATKSIELIRDPDTKPAMTKWESLTQRFFRPAESPLPDLPALPSVPPSADRSTSGEPISSESELSQAQASSSVSSSSIRAPNLPPLPSAPSEASSSASSSIRAPNLPPLPSAPSEASPASPVDSLQATNLPPLPATPNAAESNNINQEVSLTDKINNLEVAVSDTIKLMENAIRKNPDKEKEIKGEIYALKLQMDDFRKQPTDEDFENLLELINQHNETYETNSLEKLDQNVKNTSKLIQDQIEKNNKDIESIKNNEQYNPTLNYARDMGRAGLKRLEDDNKYLREQMENLQSSLDIIKNPNTERYQTAQETTKLENNLQILNRRFQK